MKLFKNSPLQSLRTGRLELIVLAGEAKEIEALHKAVESGDEQTIEKVCSTDAVILYRPCTFFPSGCVEQWNHFAPCMVSCEGIRPY